MKKITFLIVLGFLFSFSANAQMWGPGSTNPQSLITPATPVEVSVERSGNPTSGVYFKTGGSEIIRYCLDASCDLASSGLTVAAGGTPITGNGVYTGTIPGQAAGTVVKWRAEYIYQDFSMTPNGPFTEVSQEETYTVLDANCNILNVMNVDIADNST